MKNMKLPVLFLVGLLLSGVAWAAPPPDTVLRFVDAGFEREFVLALDKAWVTVPGALPELQTIPRQRSRSDLMDALRLTVQTTGADVQPVLYEAGYEQTEANRRVLTRQILVELDPHMQPNLVVRADVLSVDRPPFSDRYHVVEASSALVVIDLVAELKSMSGVVDAQPLLARMQQRRWMPNDPFFPEQWHLVNTGQHDGLPGIDVRVTNVWAQGILGSNIVIGIIDDGFQHVHPDLAPAHLAELSYNWNSLPGTRLDPSPGPWDWHGTAVAGVAAARGGNEIGVAGVAPFASMAGLRLISLNVTDLDEAEAMAHKNEFIHVKNNSWGPTDDGKRLQGPGVLTAAALADSVVNGRNGLGVIHVWAGGNGRLREDNSNYDGYANSIYTISVAAVGNHGEQSSFSEPGACNVVAAPSSGGTRGVVTTDLVGEQGYNRVGAPQNLPDLDYTDTFGGTSAASPMVAGVVALMLDANPGLGWRDVQNILIRTAWQVDADDEEWIENAAGLHFNHRYGAGLVDAEAAVMMAMDGTNLPPPVSRSVAHHQLGLTIPDNDPDGVSIELDVSEHLTLEHVTVTVDITHPHRGELDIRLTGPSGVESVLAEVRHDRNPNVPSWTFMTVRHWGEDSAGTWTLTVRDLQEEAVGTLNSVTLELHGVPSLPMIELIPMDVRTRVAVGSELEFTVQATDAEGGELWLDVSDLPAGASAPASMGTGVVSTAFAWTPDAEQDGVYTVPVTASNVNGAAVLNLELHAVPLFTFANLRTESDVINDLHAPVILADFAPGSLSMWAAAVAWRVDGGEWTNLPMVEREIAHGIITYEGVLPILEAGSQVEYYVFAVDSDEQGYFSETNSFQVGISTLHVHPDGREEWPYNNWDRAFRHPQDAMAVAVDGNRIRVANGEYTGQTIVVDRAVTLESASGLGQVIIHGSNERQCLLLQADAVVSGFVFQHGFAPMNGGAVEMWAGRLENSIIRNSRALGQGGGLWVRGGHVESVTVRDNVADAEGGGVAIREARIQNALIFDNVSETTGGGLWAGDRAEIEFTTIAFNEARQGGGIYTAIGNMFMQHLIVVSNVASQAGANWEHQGFAVMLHSITSPDPGYQTTFDLDPLFANPANRDFRLRSQYGRYLPGGTWFNDPQTSPAIDMGNPFSSFDREPHPNGGRVNIGAYGNTPFASKGTDDVRKLVVVSEVAGVDPALGLITVSAGTEITSTLPASMVTNGLTRRVSQGWTLWGVEDEQGRLLGDEDHVTLSLAENAVLRWEWETEHFVSAQIEGEGTVTPSDLWLSEFSTWRVEAIADAYFEWIGWVEGTEVDTNAVRELIVDQPYELLAVFAPLRTSQGVPYHWLANLGWTNEFETAAIDDPDGDGFLNWEEYVAGTDPLDSESRLQVGGVWRSGEATLEWPVVSGRTYRLLSIADLQDGAAAPILQFHATQDAIFSLPMPTEDAPIGFFRLSVEKE